MSSHPNLWPIFWETARRSIRPANFFTDLTKRRTMHLIPSIYRALRLLWRSAPRMSELVHGNSTSNFTRKERQTMLSIKSLRGWRSPIISENASSILALLVVLASSVFLGCQSQKAAAPPPPAEVEVVSVVQRDVPIYGEWVATLDGYVNAQIQPQVSGYLIKQSYKEGSFVRKGQVLFEIDPRPFQAVLDQAKAQLAQAQAQLGKTQLDVDRDTPLAKDRAIAQSQLDNDIQANLAAKASVKAAEAQVEQAQLNLDFTHVTSLVDGIAGIAQVQIGNLVNQTAALTSVSQVNPIKAYFPISEQEYMHYAARINAHNQQEVPSDAPPFDLILADGTVYPHKGTLLLTDRQVDVTTGSIRVVCAFPNLNNILRPGQFGRVHAAGETRNGALLVPQRSVT